MEILNEMFTEGEDAYFDFKEFRNNQELVECFRPQLFKIYLQKSH